MSSNTKLDHPFFSQHQLEASFLFGVCIWYCLQFKEEKENKNPCIWYLDKANVFFFLNYYLFLNFLPPGLRCTPVLSLTSFIDLSPPLLAPPSPINYFYLPLHCCLSASVSSSSLLPLCRLLLCTLWNDGALNSTLSEGWKHTLSSHCSNLYRQTTVFALLWLTWMCSENLFRCKLYNYSLRLTLLYKLDDVIVKPSAFVISSPDNLLSLFKPHFPWAVLIIIQTEKIIKNLMETEISVCVDRF